MLTLDTSLNRRMPFGEDESKVSRWVLLSANSAMNFSIAVVTSGESAHASKHARSVGKCAGYSQSNSRPARYYMLTLSGRYLLRPVCRPEDGHAYVKTQAMSVSGLLLCHATNYFALRLHATTSLSKWFSHRCSACKVDHMHRSRADRRYGGCWWPW